MGSPARTLSRLLWTRSSTLVRARTRPVSEERELSGVRLLMCLPLGGSTRQSGSSALELGRLLSGISSPSLSASLTSSSTLPRAPPTATQSRRRTNWSVWPSPTDKHGSHLADFCWSNEKFPSTSDHT